METHKEQTHISMIATITDKVMAQDKLIGTDSDILQAGKTKNFFPRDLREYALSPWNIARFHITKAQVLATTNTNPVILRPPMGDDLFYDLNPIYGNMFVNVVTDPANPFVCGGGDDLKLGWYNPTWGLWWNNGPFDSLIGADITNPNTQMVRWVPFGATDTGTVQAWDSGNVLSQNAALALGPRFNGVPGWIAGDGYWEVEIMYRLTHAKAWYA